MASLMTIQLNKNAGASWGFRLQGGKDFATPLCIQKVNGGSVAEKAGLQAGDAIVSISNQDALTLRHKEAQDTIVKAGNAFDIVIQRGAQVWRPNVTALPEVKNLPDGVPVATKTSLAASQKDYRPIGTGHNTAAAPFGEHLVQQYNSPLPLYSEDSIAETLSAQAEVLGKGVLGINFKKYAKEEKIRTDSPTYKLLHGEEEPSRKPRPAPLLSESGSHMPFQKDPTDFEQAPLPSQGHSAGQSGKGSDLQPGENICIGCQRLIVGVFVRVKNKNLHAECFKCSTCGSSLKNVGYYNINDKLYCDIHAKQAARTNPPAPNMEPITVQPGASLPAGALTTPQASRMKIPSAFQQPKGPAPMPASAPIRAPVSAPAPHQPFVPAPAPAPAPVAAAPMKTAAAPAPAFCPSANPQGFGAPAGDVNVRSHIPKKGDVPFGGVSAPAPMNFGGMPAPAPINFGGGMPAPAPMNFAPAPMNFAPAPAPAPMNFAPAPAPMNFAPAPVMPAGFGSGMMPKPVPPPNMGGKIGPGGPARGIPQAPGQRTAPRRGRGVMNQASASRIPVCSTCQRQIRGPFVSALGKTWCPDHFICATATCKKNIIDMGFVEEQGGLYCEVCYENFMAPICGKCDKRVKGDCLNAVGKQFHPECFCCAYCGKVFGSGAFYLEDGLPYCETDWNDLFTTKCVGCNFPIEAGDRWVEALNNNYHSQCFKCSKCHKNLEGQSFFAKGGKPFCKAHAQRGF